MKKNILTVFFFLFSGIVSLTAQEASSESGLQLDSLSTVEVSSRPINDYTLIGVNYGVTFANMYFSPSKHNRAFVTTPNYVSVTFTKFCKMFDRIPNFALVVGAAVGNEGFSFKTDKETGSSPVVDGANWCSIRVIEVPALAQIHFDFPPGKIMANAGIYGGWRESIERFGPSLDDEWKNSFRSYEHRFDYGFQGGAGFALMFDPVEIHFNCLVRWSWSNLYEPDYASKYYYNYAYPFDVIATVGLHFQLTKRSGKTRREIRKEAYDIVYGKTEDTAGKDR